MPYPGYVPPHPFVTPGHIKTPVLIMTGENDVRVTPEYAKILIDKCDNAQVEIHNGGKYCQKISVLPRIDQRLVGHFIPTKPRLNSVIVDFLKSFSDASTISTPIMVPINIDGMASDEYTDAEDSPVTPSSFEFAPLVTEQSKGSYAVHGSADYDNGSKDREDDESGYFKTVWERLQSLADGIAA